MTRKYTEPRPTVVCDTECYINYWSIAFECIATGRRKLFEFYDGHPLDRNGIAKILRNNRIITFKGTNYDVPMICLAMQPDVTNAQLKKASNSIIEAELRYYQFEELYGVTVPDWLDHIDLENVNPAAPQMPSLKLMGGRLHSRTIQDLPFDADAYIGPEERVVMRGYVFNDTSTTKELYLELRPQIELREQMSEQYWIDLRSKSDAQIAEAIIKSEIERIYQRSIYKPKIQPGTFKLKPPSFVRFETPYMRQVLNTIKGLTFVVGQNGLVNDPPALKGLDIKIGDAIYRMGKGGLHSQESSVCYLADDEYENVDVDVTGYYPSLIINNNFWPRHLPDGSILVYRSIRDRRAKAKKQKLKAIAETLKIATNGGFGKMGSPYSVLYDAEMMIHVTLSGQLSILMLIEQCEARGFKVISANTDGMTVRVDRSRKAIFEALCVEWEWDTGLGLEYQNYEAIYYRDVNNYIALKTAWDEANKQWLHGQVDGVKRKGDYALAGPGQDAAAGMKKTPAREICIEAAIAYLKDGVPIEDTIEQCDDIRKFVVVRRVDKPGAEKDGVRLGKAVRWYYSTEEAGCITRIGSGDTVPKSQGAKPCMVLPDELPDDIDFDWYIRETHAILHEIGVSVEDPSLRGRSGTMLARMPDQKTIHTVELPSGVALCGKRQSDLREKWVEYKSVQEGNRHCAKCRKALEL